jgi:hypothetical protein
LAGCRIGQVGEMAGEDTDSVPGSSGEVGAIGQKLGDVSNPGLQS